MGILLKIMPLTIGIVSLVISVVSIILSQKTAAYVQKSTFRTQYLTERFNKLNEMRLELVKIENRTGRIFNADSYDPATDSIPAEKTRVIFLEYVKSHTDLKDIVERYKFYLSENVYDEIQREDKAGRAISELYTKASLKTLYKEKEYREKNELLLNEVLPDDTRSILILIISYIPTVCKICDQEIYKVRRELESFTTGT